MPGGNAGTPETTPGIMPGRKPIMPPAVSRSKGLFSHSGLVVRGSRGPPWSVRAAPHAAVCCCVPWLQVLATRDIHIPSASRQALCHSPACTVGVAAAAKIDCPPAGRLAALSTAGACSYTADTWRTAHTTTVGCIESGHGLAAACNRHPAVAVLAAAAWARRAHEAASQRHAVSAVEGKTAP